VGEQNVMIRYRPATVSDARRLFEWRNDHLTREMSRSTELVGWDEHFQWLKDRLARNKPDLYIAQIGDGPIGSFRIDGDRISYVIAPDCRGRGYAIMLLKLVRKDFGEKQAEIFRRNGASIKAAEQSGHQIVLLD
jgi:RimJ/RimL family protein N-acetyltransferase